jgi:hypothetical protein
VTIVQREDKRDFELHVPLQGEGLYAARGGRRISQKREPLITSIPGVARMERIMGEISPDFKAYDDSRTQMSSTSTPSQSSVPLPTFVVILSLIYKSVASHTPSAK